MGIPPTYTCRAGTHILCPTNKYLINISNDLSDAQYLASAGKLAGGAFSSLAALQGNRPRDNTDHFDLSNEGDALRICTLGRLHNGGQTGPVLRIPLAGLGACKKVKVLGTLAILSRTSQRVSFTHPTKCISFDQHFLTANTLKNNGRPMGRVSGRK